jgi:hypothetical protein
MWNPAVFAPSYVKSTYAPKYLFSKYLRQLAGRFLKTYSVFQGCVKIPIFWLMDRNLRIGILGIQVWHDFFRTTDFQSRHNKILTQRQVKAHKFTCLFYLLYMGKKTITMSLCTGPVNVRFQPIFTLIDIASMYTTCTGALFVYIYNDIYLTKALIMLNMLKESL